MLFAYGTLQDSDILLAVLGRTVPAAALQSAVAHDFAVVYYPGRPYPALVTAPGTQASGMLITGLDADDLQVLDAFEGEEYRRSTLQIICAGATLRADAYLPTQAIRADAVPWSLPEWTLRHKPGVVASETASASALRQRLSAPDQHNYSILRHQ